MILAIGIVIISKVYIQMSNEFTHVVQFYETILTFAVPLLIIQRILMMAKDLHEKYAQVRAQEFDDQIDWKKRFQAQRDLEKQVGLKQQLKEKQADETARNMEPKQQAEADEIKDQTPKVASMEEVRSRKSSGASNKSNKSNKSKKSEKSKKSVGSKEQMEEISDKIEETPEPEGARSSIQKVDRKSSVAELKNTEMMAVTEKQKQQASENKQEKQQQKKVEAEEEDPLVRQYKDKQKMRFFKRVDASFNQYIPILMCVLIVGSLTQSTYIFSMCCFFGFVFSSLIFNYINLLSKIQRESKEDSFFVKANQLIAGVFIIALFVSYWFDNEFEPN